MTRKALLSRTSQRTSWGREVSLRGKNTSFLWGRHVILPAGKRCSPLWGKRTQFSLREKDVFSLRKKDTVLPEGKGCDPRWGKGWSPLRGKRMWSSLRERIQTFLRENDMIFPLHNKLFPLPFWSTTLSSGLKFWGCGLRLPFEGQHLILNPSSLSPPHGAPISFMKILNCSTNLNHKQTHSNQWCSIVTHSKQAGGICTWQTLLPRAPRITLSLLPCAFAAFHWGRCKSWDDKSRRQQMES